MNMEPATTTAGDGNVPALQHALVATLKHNGLLRSSNAWSPPSMLFRAMCFSQAFP